ncbi:MAG: hypothetical protein WD448_00915 [Woeseia sp.]
MKSFATVAIVATGAILLLVSRGSAAAPCAEDRILAMLNEPAEFHRVSPAVFRKLGWDLPDAGATVKKLADAAPGGALHPRDLEQLPAAALGYRAKWHELRYEVYGLDWDISGLHLVPQNPLANMPTIVIINGGAANWYEFFLDPLNRAGLGQYLAQKIPVLLVSIPGNYRHGGWAEDDFAARAPAYLLDRELAPQEVAVRNSVYTFRVISKGVETLLEQATAGPLVIVGHSTGGEVQFLLKNSRLRSRIGDLSFGWGTGGPAGSAAMQEFRGQRDITDYPHVSQLRPRTPDQYAGGYLGPLNPFWNPDHSRQAMAEAWMGREQQRRAQFKQPLQDMEHSSTDYLKPDIAAQIRRTLEGNPYGVDADEVIDDLFTTMEAPLDGYRRMIWTTARLDTGHWNEDPSAARELRVAEEFRAHNPHAAIRVLLFDVPMTHYGHIEQPRELAGGLIAALRWLVKE